MPIKRCGLRSLLSKEGSTPLGIVHCAPRPTENCLPERRLSGHLLTDSGPPRVRVALEALTTCSSASTHTHVHMCTHAGTCMWDVLVFLKLGWTVSHSGS